MKISDYKRAESFAGKTVKKAIQNYGDYFDYLIIFTDNSFTRFNVHYEPDGGSEIGISENEEIAQKSMEAWHLYKENLIPKKEWVLFHDKEKESEKENRRQEYLRLKKEFG